MEIRFRKNLLVLAGQGPDLGQWLAAHEGHVFRVKSVANGALLLGLGPEDEARRTPVNITSKAAGTLRLISNFAETPFELDGLAYASIEGFWQGLKYPDDEDRRRLGALHGAKAKDAGFRAPAADAIVYQDVKVRVGTSDHWRLMRRACDAKFEQHAPARDALLSTGERPLVHQMKRDSRTIPGVIMAQIWMQVRARLRAAKA